MPRLWVAINPVQVAADAPLLLLVLLLVVELLAHRRGFHLLRSYMRCDQPSSGRDLESLARIKVATKGHKEHHLHHHRGGRGVLHRVVLGSELLNPDGGS